MSREQRQIISEFMEVGSHGFDHKKLSEMTDKEAYHEIGDSKIQLEKERVLKGIKEESATLLSLALEKIIGKKIDVNQDKEIIEEMIHKMK
jgi:F0F1-type ATP synthase membrane subunit b/b'